MPDSSYFGSSQAGLPSAPGSRFMPVIGNYELTRNSLNSGIQNVAGAFDQGATGPFKSFVNYVSGKGALQANDETGTLSIAPGGSFELKSKQGFGVTGNPVNKALGVSIPVKVGGNRGIVGFQGSWGLDPSIQANFQFGKNVSPGFNSGQLGNVPSVSSPEQQINAALGLNQTYDQDRKIYSEPYTGPGPSPRDFLNQKIEEYRSSGGRDPSSPSSWR